MPNKRKREEWVVTTTDATRTITLEDIYRLDNQLLEDGAGGVGGDG